MQSKLLIVHDFEKARRFIRDLAAEAGLRDWVIREATTERDACRLIEREEFLLAVVDLCLDESPGSTRDQGLRVIKHLLDHQPVCRIIGITAAADVIGSGVRMINAGAHDFISETWSRWGQDLQRRLEIWGAVAAAVGIPSVA